MRVLVPLLACALALPALAAASGDDGETEANLTRTQDAPPARTLGVAAPVGIGLVLLAAAWVGARVARRPA